MSQTASTLIQIGQTAILARLLNPHDYGIMAMAMVVTGFIQIYSDCGVSGGIIQKQTIEPGQLSSLYVLNLITGMFFFVLVASFAPVVAIFFQEPELTPVLRWLSLGFVISAVGNQYRALNQKCLRFALLGKIEILSALSGASVAVYCAVKGWGVNALVSGYLTGLILSNLFNLMTGLKHHMPSVRFRVTEIRYFIRFGLFQMGENTLNYFNSQLDVILIGRLLGAETLGFYSVAKGLCMRPAGLVNPIFNRVAFPVMARVQNNKLALKKIYLRGCQFLAFVNAPIYSALFVAAEPVIQILYGGKWLAMAPLMQVLALYCLVRSTGNPVGSLLLSIGRVDLGFKWNLALFCFIPLSVWAGATLGGALGAASALLGLQCVLLIPNWWFLVRPCCDMGFWEYHRVLLRPFFMAAIAGIAAWFFMEPSAGAIAQLAIVSIVGAAVYLALAKLFDPAVFLRWKPMAFENLKGQ